MTGSHILYKFNAISPHGHGITSVEPSIPGHFYRDPGRGFRELGEWGPKQPGSQEHDAKKDMEQGAEESNLGSMEKRVCHKIIVFYTVEIFNKRGILTKDTPIVHFRTDFKSGSKFTNVRGAGRYKNKFREHEKLFWGASRK